MLVILFLLIPCCVATSLKTELENRINEIYREIKNITPPCGRYAYAGANETLGEEYSIKSSNPNSTEYKLEALYISVKRFNEFIPISNRFNITYDQSNGEIHWNDEKLTIGKSIRNLFVRSGPFTSVYYLTAAYLQNIISDTITNNPEWKATFNTPSDITCRNIIQEILIKNGRSSNDNFLMLNAPYTVSRAAPPIERHEVTRLHTPRYMSDLLMGVKTQQWLISRFNLSYAPIANIYAKLDRAYKERLCAIQNPETEFKGYSSRKKSEKDIRDISEDYPELLITDVNCIPGHCHISLLNPSKLVKLLDENYFEYRRISDNMIEIDSASTRQSTIGITLLFTLLCIHIYMYI